MKGKYLKVITLMLVILFFSSTSIQAIKISKKENIELKNNFKTKFDENILNDLDPNCDLEVTVTIKKIRALEEFDKFSEPDFYVIVRINDEEFISKTWKNQKFIEEDWQATSNVPDDEEFVDIEIELWEKNPLFDTLCDIAKNDNDNPDRKSLKLSYSLKSGHWTGDDHISWLHTWDPDYSGYGRGCGTDDNSIYEDDGDCEIWFDITQTDTDGDGIPYWTEVNEFGTDPMVDNTGEDFDEDNVPIEWEWKWGHYFDWRYNHSSHEYIIENKWQYHPFEWENHTDLDPDCDSLTNYEEYLVSEWYSDPFRKDIYVELDEMDEGPNGEPRSKLPEESKELMYLAFNRQNIVFHLDDGEMGGHDIVPFDTTGDNTTRQELDDIYYHKYFLNEDENYWKRGVFHYGIVVYNATFPGFCYRKDAYQISSKGMDEKARSIFTGDRDIVYATGYMHELGHSLGLMWLGGHSRDAYYPWQILFWKFRPYESIMNYGYMYGTWKDLCDYSDGSNGRNDFDDWNNIDFSYFDEN